LTEKFSQALRSFFELPALTFTARALCFVIHARGLGGLLSSPRHPITASPHLHFCQELPIFLWMTPNIMAPIRILKMFDYKS
jgi:hypothetical protein